MSVFTIKNSTPRTGLFIIRRTQLHPPPPIPTTVIRAGALSRRLSEFGSLLSSCTGYIGPPLLCPDDSEHTTIMGDRTYHDSTSLYRSLVLHVHRRSHQWCCSRHPLRGTRKHARSKGCSLLREETSLVGGERPSVVTIALWREPRRKIHLAVGYPPIHQVLSDVNISGRRRL